MRKAGSTLKKKDDIKKHLVTGLYILIKFNQIIACILKKGDW